MLSAACVKYSKVELCTQAATLPYPCTHVPIEEEDPQLLCVQCLLPLLLMLPLLLPLLPLHLCRGAVEEPLGGGAAAAGRLADS